MVIKLIKGIAVAIKIISKLSSDILEDRNKSSIIATTCLKLIKEKNCREEPRYFLELNRSPSFLYMAMVFKAGLS